MFQPPDASGSNLDSHQLSNLQKELNHCKGVIIMNKDQNINNELIEKNVIFAFTMYFIELVGSNDR